MTANVVKALVPTAIAAALLSQEFPSASLDTDGTLFTVVIYGLGYSEAVSRIREWMRKAHVGRVLVTDGETAEDLLEEAPLGRLGGGLPGRRPTRARRHA